MSTTTVSLKQGKDLRYFEVRISGPKFAEILQIVKNLPVRDYEKESRVWIVPAKDLMMLVKELKSIHVDIKADQKIKDKYIEYLDWRKNQLINKSLTADSIHNFMDSIQIKNKLYSFQIVGSYFLYKAKDALLCDMVGLGKTVQSITAVEKHMADKSINFCIIVCPSTLKRNWEAEIEKWTHKSCFVVGGDKKTRAKQYKSAYKFDYMIINYELLNYDMTAINELIITKGYEYAIIIDEIQYIKNHNAKRSENTKMISYFAKYSIGISATAIENSLMDLWSIFHGVDTTVFGGERLYWHFKDKFIKLDWFGNPIGYKNEDMIKKRMSPYIIRRMKEDVLDDLPDRVENNYWIELSDVQRKFYNDVKNQITTGITDREKADKITFAEILPMITYLRQCVLSSALVGHPENISTKLTALLEFMESIDENSKVVCFCHFVEMVELIKKSLDEKKIKNICIHGNPGSKLFCSINDRVKKLDEFNNDPNIKILVTSDILTEGVNITSANYLVNFDLLFNPAKMEQRVGRIDRIGNKHKVINIVNFIAVNTIDEIVYKKILSKKEMSVDILDNNKIESRMSFKDIKSLLEIE